MIAVARCCERDSAALPYEVMSIGDERTLSPGQHVVEKSHGRGKQSCPPYPGRTTYCQQSARPGFFAQRGDEGYPLATSKKSAAAL